MLRSAPPGGEMWTQKLRSHLFIIQSSKFSLQSLEQVSSLYSHACCAYCLDFFLAIFCPASPLACIFFFSQNLSPVFPVIAVANKGSCVGPHNTTGHPARRLQMIDAGSRVECPRNINRLQNTWDCASWLAFWNYVFGSDFPREIGVFCKTWGVFCIVGDFVKFLCVYVSANVRGI